MQELLNSLSNIFATLNNTYILFGNFIKTSFIPRFYNMITELFPSNKYYFANLHESTTKVGLWSNFLYPATITTLNDYNLFFCMNTNLRIDSPVLYYKLQQEYYKRNTINIIFFGINGGIYFPHQYIKHTNNYLKKLAAGKAKLVKNIKQQKILIFVGSTMFKQLQSLQLYIQMLQQTGILFNIIGVWKNPVNITQSLLSINSPITLTYYYINQISQEQWRLFISINETVAFLNLKNQINLFIGTHAPKNINNYHIILPIAHHYETTGGAFNFQGLYQITNKAIDNPHLFYEFMHILTPLEQYLHMYVLKKVAN